MYGKSDGFRELADWKGDVYRSIRALSDGAKSMVAPVQNRSSLQVMRDTVSALMIRELKTRFGSSRLGYFWAVAEPALQASIIAVLFTIIGRTSLSGVPVALFLIVAILPFRGFFKIAVQLSAAIHSNKALFCYRQVSPIDPFVTRMLIEIATYLIVYSILFLTMGWIGFSVMPDKPLELVMINLLMFAMASGYGLVLCSSALYYEDTTKIVSLITQPLFLLSGVFFAITMVPAQYWHYLTWNPLLHITEISRDAMFSSYETPVGDWWYISTITICLWGLGLSLYWVNRQRFIAS